MSTDAAMVFGFVIAHCLGMVYIFWEIGYEQRYEKNIRKQKKIIRISEEMEFCPLRKQGELFKSEGITWG